MDTFCMIIKNQVSSTYFNLFVYRYYSSEQSPYTPDTYLRIKNMSSIDYDQTGVHAAAENLTSL